MIREALSSRLGRPVKGLRMDELRDLLATRGFPPREIHCVIGLLEHCDHARFAPRAGEDVATSLDAVQDTASDSIDVIEKAPLADEARA